MIQSLLILELEFLHIRGGCSLVIVFFLLMLVDMEGNQGDLDTKYSDDFWTKKAFSMLKEHSRFFVL